MGIRKLEKNVTLALPTIFLDRDGVLVVDHGYVGDKDKIELMPGCVEGLQNLRAAGFRLVVVTNQSGIARGYYSLADMQSCHAQMQQLISAAGGPTLDGVMYCPHHVKGPVEPYKGNCKCRKPLTGMFETWHAQRATVDRTRSWMIGDKQADVQAGQAFGLRVAQIKGAHALDSNAPHFSNLSAATDYILQNL